MPENGHTSSHDSALDHEVAERLNALRKGSLDLTRRNPLVSLDLSSQRTNAFVRLINTSLAALGEWTESGRSLNLAPLPNLDDTPQDESGFVFQQALTEALAELGDSSEFSGTPETLTFQEERAIRDEVRERLGMAALPHQATPELKQHAAAHGINPDFWLHLNQQGPGALGKLQTRMLPDTLSRKLRGLHSKSQTWQQETGINVLYLAFGFLEYKDRETGRDSLSPILLYPVEMTLKRTTAGSVYSVTPIDGSPHLNAVLTEMLRNQYDLALPELGDTPPLDYLAQLATLNPQALKTRVCNFSTIGVFPSARLAIYRDLDPEASDIASHKLVCDLLGGSKGSSVASYACDHEADDWILSKDTPEIVGNVDSSQFSALIDIKSGRNLSIEGPPGTGKSETIANAIVDAVASGKKVLFVASKLAALEVVKNRLIADDLGDFCLPLLAGFSSRKAFFESIRKRIEIPAPVAPPSSTTIRTKLSQIADELNLYAKTLSEKFKFTGLTVFELLAKASSVRETFRNLPRAVRLTPIRNISLLSGTSIADAKGQFVLLSEAASNLADDEGNWSGYTGAPVNEFIVDDIFDEFDMLIEISRSRDAHIKVLRSYGITPPHNKQRIRLLADALNAISENEDHLPAALLRDILARSSPANFIRFLNIKNDLRSLRSQHKDLTGIDLDGSRPFVFSRLAADLGSKFPTGQTLPEAEKDADHRGRLLEIQEKRVTEILSISSLFPSSEEITPKNVNRAIRALREIPKEHLKLQTHISSSRLESAAAKSGLERLLTLQASTKRLESLISNPLAVAQSNDFTKIYSALKDTRIRRFLSPRFYWAKRRYTELTGVQFNATDSTSILSELYQIRERGAFIENNNEFRRSIGALYNGAETDGSLIVSCVSLKAYLEETFASCTPLLRLLRNPEESELEKLYGTELPSSAATFDQLKKDLASGETELTLELSLLEAWRNAQEAEPALNGLTVGELDAMSALHSKVAKHINELEELDSESLIFTTYFSANLNFIKGVDHIVNVLEEITKSCIPIIDEIQSALSAPTHEVHTALRALLSLSEKFDQSLARLSSLAGSEFTDALASTAENVDEALLQRLKNDKRGLYLHSALCDAKERLAGSDFESLMDSLLASDLPPSEYPNIFDAIVFSRLARAALESNNSDVLKYGRKRLESLREQAAELEHSLRNTLKNEIRYRCFHDAKPKTGYRGHRVGSYTELQLLKHETKKKQRFISVRQAIHRAGTTLRELKPCWMMSPLAVAQYIDRREPAFDLCIIDEASQMVPVEALGAISRAKQVVVVGDRHQLPPTNFYQVKALDSEEAELSILDIANLTFEPIRQLRWHYRSKHPSLIQFSNHHIYQDRLLIPPTPSRDPIEDPVSFRPVRGTYKNGLNTEEARALVEYAIHLMEEEPEKSIGIVTMNIKQAELIREELELAISSNTHAQRYIRRWEQGGQGRNSIFVKNLENVQGDERDIILIGTLYGPETQGGTVAQRFGPITGPTGPRRLNVLFSRARERIVTFSSMTASDIRAEELANPGRYMLKKWLSFCETGELGRASASGREPDSEFERMVMDAVTSLGYHVHPQVGESGFYIDIGVYHDDWPHSYLLGIECDGASYHTTRSARERDKHRQDILEDRGWAIHRVWSTDWFSNRDAEIALLRQKLNDILSQKVSLNNGNGSGYAGEPRDKEAFNNKSGTPVSSPAPVEGPEAAIGRHTRKGAGAGFSGQLDFNLTSQASSGPNAEGGASAPENAGAKPEIGDLASSANLAVEIGDLVSIHFLDGACERVSYLITDGMSDLALSRINLWTPLAQCLLGATIGETIEFNHAGRMRLLVIDKVDKSA